MTSPIPDQIKFSLFYYMCVNPKNFVTILCNGKTTQNIGKLLINTAEFR